MAKEGEKKMKVADFRKINFINNSISAGASLLCVFFLSQSYLDLRRNTDDINAIKSDMKLIKCALRNEPNCGFSVSQNNTQPLVTTYLNH